VPAVLMACAASGYHAPRHPARLTMRRDAGGYLATRRHTRLAPRRAALSDDELAQRRKDRAEQAAAAAKAEKDEMKEEAQVEVYGYDDEDVNYWLDDDEDSMTFSTEKATLSGVGDAFGDLTVENVARDYRFPVSYIADVIASFGVQPPISDAARVRDLLDADQAFALLEAVTSLDASEVDDDYVSFGLAGCAKRLEAGLAEIFALCVDNNFALPHGVETRLRRTQFDVLASSLGWRAADDVAPVRYEDFGFKPLDETAEPLDPDARAMQDYVQEADRGNYLDGM